MLRKHLLNGYTIKQPVSVEQLNSIKDEIQGLTNEVNEILQRQDKADIFVYEELGKVYETLNEITKEKRLQEEKPHRRIGFRVPNDED